MFGVTGAGGLKADPGTGLPYDHSGGFSIRGTGLEGEPPAGSFDYVVAIDRHRRPGTSPRDWVLGPGAPPGRRDGAGGPAQPLARPVDG
ncbi:hypothetical protein [Actinacidiphila glaucinigra]|uniref:hypothetical protein n=1 Tax=Actinacidiphila glaucinigra TaxID=235986 RepID=UPI000B76E2DD|nr:hypothetical protein [Actinacidiphila glaucinigra]